MELEDGGERTIEASNNMTSGEPLLRCRLWAVTCTRGSRSTGCRAKQANRGQTEIKRIRPNETGREMEFEK